MAATAVAGASPVIFTPGLRARQRNDLAREFAGLEQALVWAGDVMPGRLAELAARRLQFIEGHGYGPGGRNLHKECVEAGLKPRSAQPGPAPIGCAGVGPDTPLPGQPDTRLAEGCVIGLVLGSRSGLASPSSAG